MSSHLANSRTASSSMTIFTRRFPVVSGFKVTWDSRRPPGQRVVSVALGRKPEEHKGVGLPQRTMEEEAIPRERDGKRYKVVTRDYMAEGHDGYIALKGKPYLVDHESGSLMSIIVRKYLLGMQSFPSGPAMIDNGLICLQGLNS